MRKTLLLILSIIVLSLLTTIGHAQEEVFLEELGIISDASNEELGSDITRAEFVRMVAIILRLNKRYSPQEQVFTDVTEHHFAYNEIQNAYEQGLIKGIDGKFFQPSGKVYPLDAARVAVYALGYKPLIEQEGDYALSKYIQNLGILRGINAKNDKALTKLEAYKLIVNTLNADLCRVVGFDEGKRVQVISGVTLLTEVYGIEKVTGIVTATQYATLALDLPLPANAVRVNDAVYHSSPVDTFFLIGKNVTCYYYSDDNRIAGIVEHKNTVETARVEDFEGISGSSVTFMGESGRSVHFPISSSTTFLLNNNILREHEIASGFEGTFGDVEFIDNNNDGIYEIVRINKYETYIFSGYNVHTQTITTQQGRQFRFTDDYKGIRLVNTQGKPIKPEDISYDSVLSVFDPQSSEHYIYIIVTDSKLEMVVEQVSPQDRTIADESMRHYKVREDIISGIFPGEKYRLYFDHTDVIVKAQNLNALENVVYLISIKQQPGILGGVSLMYLKADGKIEISQAARKVEFVSGDGQVEYLTGQQLYEALTVNNQTRRQIAMLTLNGQGAVSSIALAAEADKEDASFRKLDFGYDKLNTNEKIYRFRYSTATLSFRNVIRMHSGTIVFVVPSASETNVSEEDFEVSGPQYFVNSALYDISSGTQTGRYMPVPISLVSGGLLTDVLVWEYKKDISPSIPDNAFGFLVTRISQLLDEEDRLIFKITGINALGDEVSYLYYDEEYSKPTDKLGRRISLGDVIRIGVYGEGPSGHELVQTFYDVNANRVSPDAASVAPGYYRYNSPYRLTPARVLSRSGNYYKCLVDSEYNVDGQSSADGILTDKDVYEIYDFSSVKVVTYSKRDNKYEFGGSLPEVGDEFIICMQNGVPRMIIIYK